MVGLAVYGGLAKGCTHRARSGSAASILPQVKQWIKGQVRVLFAPDQQANACCLGSLRQPLLSRTEMGSFGNFDLFEHSSRPARGEKTATRRKKRPESGWIAGWAVRRKRTKSRASLASAPGQGRDRAKTQGIFQEHSSPTMTVDCRWRQFVGVDLEVPSSMARAQGTLGSPPAPAIRPGHLAR